VTQRQQCEATTAGGQRCRTLALPGKTCCVFHSPEHAEARAAGRRAGGKRRSQPAPVAPPDTPDAPLTTVAEVVTMLGRVVNEMHTGRLDVRVGNGCVYGCAALLRALQPGEIERQIAALQAEIQAIEEREKAARGQPRMTAAPAYHSPEPPASEDDWGAFAADSDPPGAGTGRVSDLYPSN
jgi:hypothetical protein